MDIKELANAYGSLDLLTAYVVRETNLDISGAENLAYIIYDHVDNIINEYLSSENE